MAVVDAQVDRGDRHHDPAGSAARPADVLRPALVLLNPHAAGGRAGWIAEPLRAWLAAEAPTVPLVLPSTVQEGLAQLRALPRGGRAVLVGGDGTVHRMLPAFADGGLEMGLVPFGSGNDFARALGLHGWRWTRALAHALVAPSRAIDIGEADVDGQRVPFASSFTAGFDSSVGRRAVDGPARLRGLPRYLLATLRELVDLRHWTMQVRADGRPVLDGAALFASVLNTRTFGSGMPAVPQARIDDGRLDLLVAGPLRRGPVALLLPRLLAGRHLSHPQVHTCRFERLEATAPAEVPLAGDGEPLGSARAWRVLARPGALRAVAAQG